MNAVDILLLFIILLVAIGGWFRGFIVGALDLLRWIAGLFLALWLYKYVELFFVGALGLSEVWGPPLAFLFTLVFILVGLSAASRALLRRIPSAAHRSFVNRAFGILPGAVHGAICAAVSAVLLLTLPFPEPVPGQAQESPIANRLAAETDRLEEALAPAFDDAIARTLTRLTVEPESEKGMTLPFKVARSTPRPDLEAEMLVLLNEERVAEGLKPLVADTALRAVARAHSADMFARGYFSHVSPEGATPFDRIIRAQIRFRTAGENLALAPTVEIAHSGLMNSPGHRANILRPAFGRVGIGIMDGGRRGVMVSQEFRN